MLSAHHCGPFPELCSALRLPCWRFVSLARLSCLFSCVGELLLPSPPAEGAIPETENKSEEMTAFRSQRVARGVTQLFRGARPTSGDPPLVILTSRNAVSSERSCIE